MKLIEITMKPDIFMTPIEEINHLTIDLGYPSELIVWERDRDACIADALPMNPVVDEASHNHNGIEYRYIRNQGKQHTERRLGELLSRGVILGWRETEVNLYGLH